MGEEAAADNDDADDAAAVAAAAAASRSADATAAAEPSSRRVSFSPSVSAPSSRRASRAGGANASPEQHVTLTLLPGSSKPLPERPGDGGAARGRSMLTHSNLLAKSSKSRKSGRVTALGDLDVEVYWVREPLYNGEEGALLL